MIKTTIKIEMSFVIHSETALRKIVKWLIDKGFYAFETDVIDFDVYRIHFNYLTTEMCYELTKKLMKHDFVNTESEEIG